MDDRLCVLIPQRLDLHMMQIKEFPLKLVFIIHFVLMAWALQADGNNESYLFYNLIFFVTLFWGMYAHESDEPIQLAFIVNCLCLVLDMITLFNIYEGGRPQQVSVAVIAVNFVIRPLTLAILWRIMQIRNNTLGTTNAFGFEDINHQVIHSVPQKDESQTGSFNIPVTGPVFKQADNGMPPPYKS